MGRGLNNFLIALVFGAIFVFCNAFFAEGKVLISEVKVQGSVTTDEFVELYNYSSSTENLSGWKMCKYTKTGNEYVILENFSDLSIAPFGYLLLAHENYAGSVLPDIKYSSNILADNNYLYLYNPLNEIIDSAGWGSVTTSYRETPGNPSASESLVRKPDDEFGNWQDTDNDIDDFLLTISSPQNSSSPSRPIWSIVEPTTTPTTTPEISTSTPETPTTTPEMPTSTIPTIDTSSIWAQIKINEFVSNPVSGNEWLEIFNPSTSSLDLSGGYICDERGATSSYACKTATGTVPAGGWLFVDLFTASYLNNDGDSLFLKNVESVVVDSVVYSDDNATEKGQSFARLVDGADTNAISDWAITTSLTPGAGNVIVAPIVPSSGGGSSSGPANNTEDTTTEVETVAATTSIVYKGLALNEIFPNPVAF